MDHVVLANVCFSYSAAPNARVLDDVSCVIEAGSFVGVTGPNRAGKSTLCRLIAGHIPHFFEGDLTGSVTVGGQDTQGLTMATLAESMGFVFENPFDQLTGASSTVLEEAAFALENKGVPPTQIEQQARHALRQVGLEALADRDPQRLSGGETQRLALAGVLTLEPNVLLLDDPTSQLDPAGADQVFDLLTQLNRQGHTVVVATHDLERLSSRADRMLVLEGGRITFDGKPREVLYAAAESMSDLPLPDMVRVCHDLRARGRLELEAPGPLTVTEAKSTLSSFRSYLGTPSIDDDNASAQIPSSASAGQISCEDVHYSYPGAATALADLSLDIGPGCVCIIGENGAGKSTFARHLNGLVKPTTGRVIVRGRNTCDYSVAGLSRDVALAFQNPDDQLFRATVESEVRFGPQNLGYSEVDTKRLTEQALSLLDLMAVRDKKPHDLDMAQRRHVAIASSVAMDTPILVLDEPTAGQDAAGIALIGGLVAALTSTGKTVIVISHDMGFVARHADRVIVLNHGTVHADGLPRSIFAAPQALSTVGVAPPAVVQLAAELGMRELPMTPEDLIEILDTPTPDTAINA